MHVLVELNYCVYVELQCSNGTVHYCASKFSPGVSGLCANSNQSWDVKRHWHIATIRIPNIAK